MAEETSSDRTVCSIIFIVCGISLTLISACLMGIGFRFNYINLGIVGCVGLPIGVSLTGVGFFITVKSNAHKDNSENGIEEPRVPTPIPLPLDGRIQIISGSVHSLNAQLSRVLDGTEEEECPPSYEEATSVSSVANIPSLYQEIQEEI